MSTEGIGRSNLPRMPGSPSPAGDAAPVRPGSSNPPPDAGLPAPFAGRPAPADSAPAASLQPRIGLGKLQPAVPASAAVARPDVATATAAVLRLAAQGT